jgi:maltose alpha-D-glucosyltransferase/alpha-amylase
VLPEGVEQTVGTDARLHSAFGHRLAELHRAFSQSAQPIEAGAPLDPPELDRLAERATTAWERARAAMLAHRPASDTTRTVLDDLVGRHDQVLASVRAARARVPSGLGRSRIHGTLELSHVLIYEGDVWFIGPAENPIESPERRRRPETPLVDLASLLWSLQIAATRALIVRTASAPADHERLSAWARWWVAGASRVLVTSYRQATAGMAIVPEGTEGFAAILRVLLFERAFNDISRSVVTSPDWLETPGSSALALLEGTS